MVNVRETKIQIFKLTITVKSSFLKCKKLSTQNRYSNTKSISNDSHDNIVSIILCSSNRVEIRDVNTTISKNRKPNTK